MKKIICFASLILGSQILSAADYTFVDLNAPWHFGADFSTQKKTRPWHIEADYQTVGKAKFRTHGVRDTKISSQTAYGSVFYSHFVNDTNALSWQLGYNYLRFDWDKNPRFHQKDFNYGMASLAWVSHSLEQWRWVMTAGVSVDLEWLKSFHESAVYYGLLWGRLAYNQNTGLHIGFFGYAGVQNGYLLPVLGVDWKFGDAWRVNAIFPFDFSVDYYFNCNWFASLSSSSFGGPYKFPRRFRGGVDKFHDGIFQYYSTGADLSLSCDYNSYFRARVAGGYNFGGWVMIKDKHDRHGRYYKFKEAPYGIVEMSATF